MAYFEHDTINDVPHIRLVAPIEGQGRVFSQIEEIYRGAARPFEPNSMEKNATTDEMRKYSKDVDEFANVIDRLRAVKPDNIPVDLLAIISRGTSGMVGVVDKDSGIFMEHIGPEDDTEEEDDFYVRPIDLKKSGKYELDYLRWREKLGEHATALVNDHELEINAFVTMLEPPSIANGGRERRHLTLGNESLGIFEPIVVILSEEPDKSPEDVDVHPDSLKGFDEGLAKILSQPLN